MVNVPAEYDALIKQMSSSTGIPYNVIAVQANTESGFNPKAVSSAGAEGWLQFLPTTYDPLASQAGVSPGTEFDPSAESKVYDVYMNQLLQQEGGNLRNALAAYNAGPGNLAAGYGYADSILSAAKTGNITVATQPTAATTTGFSIPGLGGISVSGVTKGIVGAILDMLGLKTDLRDVVERFGLIVLGFVLLIIGIKIMSSGSGKTTVNVQNQAPSTKANSKSAAKEEAKTTTKAGSEVGASEAVEAAAVA